ncbi:ribosomal protection-like ABC-F family protein [Litchfieldia salsa]|nr:ABC-F type ribosomal protection protein [Litchfieldia salsa]
MRIRDIHKSYGDKTILKGINFDIKEGDRIGFVGNNGAGKTTFANIIHGSLSSDQGEIEVLNQTLKIGYLHQSSDYSVNDFLEVVDHQSESQVFHHTSKLGLAKVKSWEKDRMAHLSGGEKLKISLAKVWASKPDLLLLDEPTNHLDLVGLEWLVNELKAFRGAVVIISHDRYFLDRTITQIAELEDGLVKLYNGNYTNYKQQKEAFYQSQLHQYEVQQKKKARIEGQIANLENWSEKAHRQSTKQGSPSERKQMGLKEYLRAKAKKMDIQVKSKRKRLESELEKNKVDKPKEETELKFTYQQSAKRGKRILEAKDLEKRFGDRNLIHKSNFYIKQGEHIGMIGENGCGKTTLIKMILRKEHPTSGMIWMSESLKIGYLSQDVTDLDVTKTPIQATGITDREQMSKARTIFANIGLKEDKLNQPIQALSLGERTRIKLVMMLLAQVDFLILDEPTNHLDLASRESLEHVITEYAGTVLLVSHDLYFLEKISKKLLSFEKSFIHRKEMSMKEYLERKNRIEEKVDHEEERLLIQNEITTLLGKISLLSKEDETYKEIDQRLNELLKRKKELQ